MSRHRNIRFLASALLASVTLYAAPNVKAQGVPPIFGDTEIEQTVRTFSTPIWIAAGLNPDNVHIVLVDDPTLNAFVAGGQNIFVYRGFLESTDNPEQVYGVVAHETGHIAGGHLARSDADMEDASYTMMLATILGAVAAVGGHDPGAMAAALGIGEDMGIRSYLAFSRAKEASADEAGLTYTEKAHLSPRGLLEFMRKIQVQEGAPLTGDNKYLIDHPPTPDRVQALAFGLEHSAYKDTPVPPEWVEMHARMKAKLIAYFEPDQALRKYSRADTSIAGRYARSIALWRTGRIEEALPLIDALIAERPNDAYFQQAKGQMLFAEGRIAAALPAFKQAVTLAPGTIAATQPCSASQTAAASVAQPHAAASAPVAHGGPNEKVTAVVIPNKPTPPAGQSCGSTAQNQNFGEIRTEYAQAMLESDDPALLASAVEQLKVAAQFDKQSPDVHRFLAIAYGKQGNEAVAKVELAEQAILEGRTRDGRELAESAMRMLPTGSREWIHAQDLVATSQSKRGRNGGDSSGLQFSAGPAKTDPFAPQGFGGRQ